MTQHAARRRVNRLFVPITVLAVGAGGAVAIAGLAPTRGTAAETLPSAYKGALVGGRSVAAHQRQLAQPSLAVAPAMHLPAAGSALLSWPVSASAHAKTAVAQTQSIAGSALTVLPRSAVGKTAITKLRSEILDQSNVKSLGLTGLVVRLSRADNVASAAPVAVTIPAGTLTGLYGADYQTRVRWVSLPSSVTKQQLASGAVRPTAVMQTQSASGSTILTPQVSSRPIMLVASASPNSGGGAGTFAATSLRPAGSWQVSAQTGDFSWSYPFTGTTPAAGPAPNLAASYSSGSVDGETASTNNQSSVIGNGWELAGSGFIERTYTPCSLDGTGLTGDQANSGDECWSGDNDSIAFGGHSGSLVPDGTAHEFRIQGDDGSRVRYLPHAADCADGGSYGNGCWQLTSQDGTSYYFGQNANSAWTEPVFGDDNTEPCNGSSFAASACPQVWRWNLDRVVDIHGNAETFTYKTNDNYYHQNNGDLVKYVRGGYLTEADYGIAPGTSTASNRIVLGYAKYGRCNVATPDDTKCKDQTGSTSDTPTTPANYPDVPWDQNCPNSTSSCTGLASPTFWTTQRLQTVTAQAVVNGDWTTATEWTLKQQFVDPGDTSAASMWLSDITHPNVSGDPLDTHFVGLSLDNRVKNDVYLPLAKQRVATINLEAGGSVLVDYDLSDCTPTMIATLNPAANSHRCFPQYWTPNGASKPILDWFNKYRVRSVTESPNTGGPNDQSTFTQYFYTSNPAWRLDTSASTQTDSRTWSSYAGYRSVEIRNGDPNIPAQQHTTDYVFFQGLDHDPDGTATNTTANYRSSSLTAGGHTVVDSPQLSGRTFETIVRNGAAGGTDVTKDVLSDTITVPWMHATALRGLTIQFHDPTSTATPAPTYNASVDTGAYETDDAVSYAISTLATGATRTVTTTNTFDGYGRNTQTNVDTPDAGSICTKTDYATDPTGQSDVNRWLLSLASRVLSFGAACGTTPNFPSQAISDTRYFYDGATDLASQPLTFGNLTRTDQVRDYVNGSGVAITVASTPATGGYDSMGRLLQVTNAIGKKTTTSYLPTIGGPLTSTTITDAPGTDLETSTTTNYSPLWEQVTSVSDPNGNVTSGTFDALGRRTNVWLPDRPQATNPTSPSITYAYVLDPSKAQSVATTTLNSIGGTITSYALADGLSRPIQTQAAMDAADNQGAHYMGGTVLTDTFYDAAGQVRLVNNSYGTTEVMPSSTLFAPSASTAVPSQTQSVWDGAGRQTAVITEGLNASTHTYGELWRTSYHYLGTDRTETTPPTGGTPFTTYTDSLGRTVGLYQYLNPAIGGANEHTAYGYDARGDMTSMTDPAGHSWSWAFDPRGNQIKAVDPDTGTTQMTYDDDNNLSTTTDTEQRQIKFHYDALDRKTGEYELQSSPSGWAQIAAWTYDSATNGKGLAATSTSYVGSTPSTLGAPYSQAVLTYDVNGRPQKTETSVDGWNGVTGPTTFDKSYSYNVAGQLAAYTEPAVTGTGTERMTYQYDGMGNLIEMDGATSYLNNILYSTTNQPSTLVFKNGSTELDRLYTYNDASKRLTNLLVTATGSASTIAANHTYTYTNSGLLTEDSNAATGKATDNQCYKYDNFQELVQAWTPTAATGCAAPTYTNLGGPAPFWQEYSYDLATGNRLTVTRHATTTGGTNTRVTSSYNTAATAQPHTLASTQKATSTTSAPTTFTNAGASTPYGSTPEGQDKTRPGQTLTWNMEGELTNTQTSAGNVSNIYDANGSLLLQTDPTTGVTLYLDDLELHIANGSSTVYKVRTYSVDGMPVLERSTTAAAPSTINAQWLDASPFGQNTSNDEVNAATGTTTHRYFDPYGNARVTPPAWSSTHTFLNAPSDATTATVHLGARDYDPALGRFLSPDSIIDTGNPLQNNGFTYGWNDPVQNADPSGNRPEGDTGDTDAGDWGGHTTCPSCTNPSPRPKSIDGWAHNTTVVDPKTVMITVKNPNQSGIGCMRFGIQADCSSTMQISLYDLMHPPPGPKNYCGGWSWACTLVGYNQARNCIANPSFDECAGAVLAIVSDVTLAGGVAKLADLLVDASMALAADSSATLIEVATDEIIPVEDATAVDTSGENIGGKTCAAMSFSPDTSVVMADGSTKPISQLSVGDLVETTDPATQRSSSEPVTAVWVHHDSDLMDLAIASGGRISTVHTTQSHLFWDVTRGEWVEASLLRHGDVLRTDDGRKVSVTSTLVVDGSEGMWDLTVAANHDFYVSTVSGSVLVHNEGGSVSGTIFRDGSYTFQVYANDHAPPHGHLKGGGRDIQLGQNGKPVDPDVSLTRAEQNVVDRNLASIRSSIGAKMREYGAARGC